MRNTLLHLDHTHAKHTAYITYYVGVWNTHILYTHSIHTPHMHSTHYNITYMHATHTWYDKGSVAKHNCNQSLYEEWAIGDLLSVSINVRFSSNKGSIHYSIKYSVHFAVKSSHAIVTDINFQWQGFSVNATGSYMYFLHLVRTDV